MRRMLCQRLQDGVGGDAEAVLVQPLEVADPDGGLGQLVGVGVDLDAVQLRGIGRLPLQGSHGRSARAAAEGDDLFPQVQQLAQGDVEKVAAAAGRVEHPDGGELVGEADEQLSEGVAACVRAWPRGRGVALGGQVRRLSLDRLPLGGAAGPSAPAPR